MWKDSIRNIVVIFQPNILRIVGFYVRHSANITLDYWIYNFLFDQTKLSSSLTIQFSQLKSSLKKHSYFLGHFYLQFVNSIICYVGNVASYLKIEKL